MIRMYDNIDDGSYLILIFKTVGNEKNNER